MSQPASAGRGSTGEVSESTVSALSLLQSYSNLVQTGAVGICTRLTQLMFDLCPTLSGGIGKTFPTLFSVIMNVCFHSSYCISKLCINPCNDLMLFRIEQRQRISSQIKPSTLSKETLKDVTSELNNVYETVLSLTRGNFLQQSGTLRPSMDTVSKSEAALW